LTKVKKMVADAARETCDGSTAGLPRLKYRIALILAEALSQLPWVKEIYYADLSSGEVVRGADSDGTDIDLIVVAENPPPGIGVVTKHLEIELNQALAEALLSAGAELPGRIAAKHGLVELHINDIYAKLVARKASGGGLSSLNAFRIWPPQQ